MKTLTLFLLLAIACGSPATGTTTSGAPAFARDFQEYDSWEPFMLPGTDADALDGGSVHTAGPRTIFLNQRPPKGATEFPVGTMIVKQGTFTTFAMHKRGGTYNAKGAHGWEWLELQKNSAGQVVIVWQGLGPPAGEKYGDINVTCNDCHSAASSNDSVLALQMQLRALE